MDDDGNLVFDTDEMRLKALGRRVDDFRKRLVGMWPPHNLTANERDRIVAAVAALVGQSPAELFGEGEAPWRRGPELRRRDLAQLRREAICRDLEVLLNTRRSLVSLPEPPGELGLSVLDFGLRAPRGAGLTSTARRETLRREIETAIQRFEPRLTSVRVGLEAESGPLERMRVRIDASLAGAQVSLRASLDSSTDRFSLLEDLS
jgi:type VI secretion system protein ImpF